MQNDGYEHKATRGKQFLYTRWPESIRIGSMLLKFSIYSIKFNFGALTRAERCSIEI